MNYGIKVSKKEFDVKTGKKGKSPSTGKRTDIHHMLLALAIPYLKGARLQIKRYQEASSRLKNDSINATNDCLHESSCLFEDLGAIVNYTKLCGEQHSLDEMWIDIRNHIRHDIRENFDVDDKRKKARIKNLGIDSHLQTSIGFDHDSIKVGNTIVELDTISKYLDWATGIINSAIDEAWKKGRIKAEGNTRKKNGDQ